MKVDNYTIVVGLIALALIFTVPSMASCAVKSTQIKADLIVRMAEFQYEEMDGE